MLGRHRMSTTHPIRTRLALGAAMTGLAMTGAAVSTPTASALTPTLSQRIMPSARRRVYLAPKKCSRPGAWCGSWRQRALPYTVGFPS
jgi:hypothetical protein